MKRLMILGASILQLPAIIKAKELGYYTIVVDYNPNAVGVGYADEFHEVSTIDEEAVALLASKIHPDGIMTLATDMPMRSVAKATTSLGIPGINYQTAVMATDKGEMIKAFEKAGVEHPWYFIVDCEQSLLEVAKRISYPCVMKPTDNAGNRGVCFVNSEEELLSLYKYSFENSRSGKVIIEEYLKGQEVSVEMIVYNNTPHILAVTDKLTLGPPYFVEIGHAEQSMLESSKLQAVKDLATRAVLSVGINNSPAHVEIMVTDNGPKMIELGSRMGGGAITTDLVPLATGIDMVQSVINMSLGLQPDVMPKFNYGAALRHIVSEEGIISSITGIDEALCIPGVIKVEMLKKVGDKVTYFKNGNDRVGYVIATSDTTDKAIEICNKALSIIKVNLV